MKKLLFCIIPMLVLIDLFVIGLITDLISKPDDLAVFTGVVLTCVFLFYNILLINFLYNNFKKQ